MSGAATIALNIPANQIAVALDGLPDYRVLRRLGPMLRSAHRSRDDEHLHGLALDVETTGLDHRSDAVIELAMCPFSSDRDGRIVGVGTMRRWLEDPGRPLDQVITRVTGITDADVRGRAISDGEAGSLLLDADYVVAHNSRFDRPFVERRLPVGAGRPWICSMTDVDWVDLGFEGRGLSHLLLQMGWFYDAHRADVDVLALLHLLDHSSDDRPRTILSEAIERARRPGWRLEAVGAPFAAKDALRARGYRWEPSGKYWSREVTDDRQADEIAWLDEVVYASRGSPRAVRIDWTNRHAAS